jgi:flagellar motor switch protein FliN/FliY
MSDIIPNFDELSATAPLAQGAGAAKPQGELEAVYDVPVRVKAVLGSTSMEISDLLKLEAGQVINLDKRVGEAVDILVNDRLVARGEVVLVDEHLGVTMTEIVKDDRR